VGERCPSGFRLGDLPRPRCRPVDRRSLSNDPVRIGPCARRPLRGGYGSLNVGLHHPGEFHVLESWSGYERADKIVSIFGRGKKRLAYNSPRSYIPDVARRLRQGGTYVWFYSSRGDRYLGQNEAFSRELARLRIRHSFLVVSGGHTWRAWRENFPQAILAASKGLSSG
jgi:enterochelin esterase-like enzyme